MEVMVVVEVIGGGELISVFFLFPPRGLLNLNSFVLSSKSIARTPPLTGALDTH